MKLQLPKGTRDFPPESKIIRNFLTDKLTKIFEKFGFSPLETPTFEKMDVLSAKYAGGEGSDVMKEVFRLSDQGKRDLGLRFDLTVPLARFIGMNPQLKMPFKRYQIGKVFRDGPIKLGRYREFWQYDVDIVGAKSMLADSEIIRVVLAVFDSLGIHVVIKINNRKIISGIIELAGIPPEAAEKVIISLDKFDKIGPSGVKKELLEKDILEIQANKLIGLLTKNTKLADFDKLLPENEGVKELKELLSLSPDDLRIKFVPNLVRGLAYYTSTVLEVFSATSDLNFSLAGGGRYDKMIGQYLGSPVDVPAVGLAFGFEPILEVLKLQNKLESKFSVTDVFVIPIGKDIVKKALVVVDSLREFINVDVDLSSKGVSKNIRFADSYKIPFVLFIGEDELKNNKFKLKNIVSGKEEVLSVKEIVDVVKKY